MQDNYIQKLLNIKDIIVTNITENSETIEVSIKSTNNTGICPCCKQPTTRIHDYRLQRVRHSNIGLRQVCLLLRKKRFICKRCNKRFYESLNFLGRYQRNTKEYIFTLLEKLKDTRSLKSISKEFKTSIPSVTRLLHLTTTQTWSLPRVLCIDEFKGNTGREKYQCILVDGVHKRIYDVLPSRKKSDLENYFSQIPKKERNKVKYFVMDMYKNYADIAKTYFPKAMIIIDKFHFARQCFWALENVRKRCQKTMDTKLRKYFKRSKSLLRKRRDKLTEEQKEEVEIMKWYEPELRDAYNLKENFYLFLNAENKNIARKELEKWIERAKQSKIPEFKACIKALENWKEEILHYFESRFTNGRTEGFNNKIKVIKRVSYGYRNFETFKKRILWCCS